MATIEFSTSQIAAILSSTFGTSGGRGLTNQNASYTSSLRIMKGTKPTDFSGMTNGATSYASDVLIDFKNDGTSTNDALTPSTATNNVFTLNTEIRTAAATGTATWFWWVMYSSATTTTILNQVMGTVGLIGSGADIEIPNVNILAGNPYRISGVKWYVPDGGFTY